MARIALFANGLVGVEVAKYLHECGDPIVSLFLHDPPNQQHAEEILELCACADESVFRASQSHSVTVLKKLDAVAPDFIITVYWSHLLRPQLFNLARVSSVNFHPALLPINRGWYPHVHSLIDGTPLGVTLHQIDAGADTGPIWAQREIFPDSAETAGAIYSRLQKEIVILFREIWPDIKSARITPYRQDESKAIYHKKKEIEALDYCNLAQMDALQLLRRLKARTFADKAFAYFIDASGEKVFMHLRLWKEGN